MKSPNYTRHFLNNSSIIKEMLCHAHVNKNDIVVDIGAGKGAITGYLSPKAAKVIAVELDSRLANSLKTSFGSHSNVVVLNMNFLTMPLPKNPFKVVANIPYNITTNILGRLLDVPNSSFKTGIIIMEWGAAKRFTEIKHTTNSRIIGWNTWFDLAIVHRVSRKSFSPAPSVQSAMVKIDRKQNPVVNPGDYYGYMAFISSFLEYPRMQMKEAFRGIFTRNQIKRICRDVNIRPGNATGNFTPLQWAHCYHTMCKLVPERIHPAMPGAGKKLYKR